MTWKFSLMTVGLACALLPDTATAQNMTVATFLAKADALQAKGMMAMLSPDIGLLKAEVASASSAYRADVEAGTPPKSCPPPKSTVKLSSEELLAFFRTIPVPQRPTTTVRAAFSRYAIQRFPCR